MKCINCGHDNAPEAKFCGRCGTAMTMAAPAAAPSAAPTKTGSPRRTAKIIVLGTLVLVLGVGGYAGYMMFAGGGMPSMPIPAQEPPKEAPPMEPPKEAAPAPQDAATPAPGTTAAPSEPAPPAEPAKSEDVAPPAMEPPKSEPTKAPPPTKAMPAPAPKAPPKAVSKAPPKVAPQSAPVEPPRPDRWALMAEEMENCKRESFLNRVVCEQKVGQKYCAGYWGMVPQCGARPQ